MATFGGNNALNVVEDECGFGFFKWTELNVVLRRYGSGNNCGSVSDGWRYVLSLNVSNETLIPFFFCSRLNRSIIPACSSERF